MPCGASAWSFAASVPVATRTAPSAGIAVAPAGTAETVAVRSVSTAAAGNGSSTTAAPFCTFGVAAPQAGVKSTVWFGPWLLVDPGERPALAGSLPGAAEADPADVHPAARVEADRRLRRRRHALERAAGEDDPGRSVAAVREEVAVDAGDDGVRGGLLLERGQRRARAR